MALFSYIGVEATGGKVLYCPFCEEKLLYDDATHAHKCPFCGCEIIENMNLIPYAAMADFCKL